MPIKVLLFIYVVTFSMNIMAMELDRGKFDSEYGLERKKSQEDFGEKLGDLFDDCEYHYVSRPLKDLLGLFEWLIGQKKD